MIPNPLRVSPSGRALTYPSSEIGKSLAVQPDGTVLPKDTTTLLNYGSQNSGKRLVVQPTGDVDVSAGSFPIITSAVGASDGDVIHLQGLTPGVYVPAQADSNLNSAGVIGVKWGPFVTPFSECPSVNFDTAPIVGAPCYLSSVTHGKLTCLVPAAGAITVPVGLVVEKDTSTLENFSAQVAGSGSLASSLSYSQQFIADAAQELGVLPSSLHSFSDDYNSLATTGFPTLGAFNSPIAPDPTHLGTSPAPSMLTWVGNNGGGNLANWIVSLGTPASLVALNLLQNTSLANQKWSFRMRFNQGAVGLSLKLWLDKGDGFEAVGVGVVSVSGSNKFVAMYGNFNPESADPTAGQRVVLGPEDGNIHVVTMTSVNDGSIRFHFDALPVIVLPLPASASATIPRLRAIATGLTIDNLQVCAP